MRTSGDQWPGTIGRLAHQLSQAQAADRRVHELKRSENLRGPNRDDYAPDEYRRLLRVHVQTPEYQAADHELTIAVALSKAHDAALLRAAHQLLARRASSKPPLRRLPRPRILPGGYTPQWWIEAISTTHAGIWRAIPSTGPELQLSGPDNPLVHEVAKQARLLQASHVGYRKRNTLYEACIPDDGHIEGRSIPPIRGLSRESGRRVSLALRRGLGMRVQHGRREEFNQLHTDYFAVWDRSRAYAAAVLTLLRACTYDLCE